MKEPELVALVVQPEPANTYTTTRTTTPTSTVLFYMNQSKKALAQFSTITKRTKNTSTSTTSTETELLVKKPDHNKDHCNNMNKFKKGNCLILKKIQLLQLKVQFVFYCYKRQNG